MTVQGAETVTAETCTEDSLFTQAERFVLKALLIDGDESGTDVMPPEENAEVEGNGTDNVEKTLSSDMLLHVPPNLSELSKQSRASAARAPVMRKDPRDYRMQVGLWQAHEDGVTAEQLKNFDNPQRRASTITALKRISVIARSIEDESEKQKHGGDDEKDNEGDGDNDADSIDSDRKILPDRPSARIRESKGEAADDEERSDSSSWAEKDGGFEHFDAWEVLKDDYAADFGFDYTPDNTFPEGDALEGHNFKILGTSADDIAAHPHVLSPPLIDSLLTFVPDKMEYENLWLKYSLIRDGASMDTFLRYVRASRNTIVAIETTAGHVFGSFTSSPWAVHPGLYGGNPSFLWRMRHNRSTPCHSLVEQAQLESEVDIFMMVDNEHLVQYCTHDMIGIGEGEIGLVEPTVAAASKGKGDNHGFGIAITDDLLRGTTSHCVSFKSPCLTNISVEGEVFDVLNLEVWTFTPCFTVDAAQKLEMTHFFVYEESMRSATSSRNGSQWSSEDLNQDKFYRRVGHDDPGEEDRERWFFRNMMDGADTGGPRTLFGASPRNA